MKLGLRLLLGTALLVGAPTGSIAGLAEDKAAALASHERRMNISKNWHSEGGGRDPIHKGHPGHGGEHMNEVRNSELNTTGTHTLHAVFGVLCLLFSLSHQPLLLTKSVVDRVNCIPLCQVNFLYGHCRVRQFQVQCQCQYTQRLRSKSMFTLMPTMHKPSIRIFLYTYFLFSVRGPHKDGASHTPSTCTINSWSANKACHLCTIWSPLHVLYSI